MIDRNIDQGNKYPDIKLEGRHKLIFDWIDSNSGVLLDAGCSYGYATKYYAMKSTIAYGLELEEILWAVASAKYPDIKFENGSILNPPYSDSFFDIVILSDLFEHLPDQIGALNEIFRILKPGGTFILTTPHKGLFALLDPYNFGYYLKKNFFWFYKLIFSSIAVIKRNKFFEGTEGVHSVKHHHYSLKNIKDMLDSSGFGNNYEIIKLKRTGLVLEPLVLIFEKLVMIFTEVHVVRKIFKPVFWLSNLDFKIRVGPLAYNIALKIRKKQ